MSSSQPCFGQKPLLLWERGHAPKNLVELQERDNNYRSWDFLCFVPKHSDIPHWDGDDYVLHDTDPPTIPDETEIPPILVWDYSEAPAEIRDRAGYTHGGDEDFIAIIPSVLNNRYLFPNWIERFAICGVTLIEQADGTIIAVGGHA